jgi:hypothetical protein
METRNITLSLPKDILTRVKVIAVERETSVSRLLADLLEGLVAREEAYGRSKRRQLELMAEGIDLGTGGARPAERDALHAR